MNYQAITKCDMLNGDGLRVVLWLSGCNHHCKGCHNPETWNPMSGQHFNDEAKAELFEELEKDYIAGITFSGGDPLFPGSREDLESLILEIKDKYPTKTIWLYTGYKYEDIKDLELIKHIDILVDGKYVEELNVLPKPFWRGSHNQRIINIKKLGI